jgi:hypothetical protein
MIIYLPTYLPASLPVCLPAYLPTYLPTYLRTYLPTYISTCLPAYLPTYPPTYLPTYLPACLPAIYLWLYSPLLGLGRFWVCLNPYTVGRTAWMGDQPVTWPLPMRPMHRITQTQNKCTQKSMPRVGLEPMTPVFEQAKTVHALDCAITVVTVFGGTIIRLAYYLTYSGTAASLGAV